MNKGKQNLLYCILFMQQYMKSNLKNRTHLSVFMLYEPFLIVRQISRIENQNDFSYL